MRGSRLIRVCGAHRLDRAAHDDPSNANGHDQDTYRSPARRWDVVTSRLAAAVAVFTLGVLADVVSTYVALTSAGFVEGSPVGRAFISRYGPLPGMFLTKAVGMVVIGLPIALAGGTRRLVATAMFAGVGLLSLAAAARNALLVVGIWP